MELKQYEEVIRVGKLTIDSSFTLQRQQRNQVNMLVGQAHFKLKNIEKAMHCFDDVYESCIIPEDFHMQISSLYWTANCYYYSSQFDFAHRKYSRVVEKTQNRKSMVETFYKASLFLATTSLRMGMTSEAIDIYTQLLSNSNVQLSHKEQIDVGLGLSWAHHSIGNTKSALDIAENIHRLSLQSNGYQLHKINSNIAVFLNSFGRHQTAFEMWVKALEFFGSVGSAQNQVIVLEEISMYHLQNGHLKEAEEQLLRAFDLINSTKSIQHGRLCRLRAYIEKSKGNLQAANEWLNFAVEVFRTCKATKEVTDTLTNFYDNS